MLIFIKKLNKHRSFVRTVFVILFVIFCLVNIYHSLLLPDNFTSSHRYLRQKILAHRPLRDASNISTPAYDIDYELDSKKLDDLRPVVAADYPEFNVIIGNEVRYVPLWQRRLLMQAKNLSIANKFDDKNGIGSPYFLTELLQVRIYEKDKSRWTERELKQWIHYLLLAGVEHIYICDHYDQANERLDKGLQRYIDAGLVTYIAWNGISRNAMWAQIRCYQRLVKRYKRRHKWQIAIDMDEYPYAPSDLKENFLVRYLERLSEEVSEVSLSNYLMLDEGDRTGSSVIIDRIVLMTKNAANALVKPLYRPNRVRAVNVHRNFLDSGIRIEAKSDELRMLHYWGASRFGSAEDRNRTLANTVEMSAMRDHWASQIRNSLVVFGEFDAFSNVTGP